MSQVTFKTKIGEQNVEIMAGWDRPLRHYFLTIFDLGAQVDDRETVWSTLEEPSPADNRSTERLRAKLSEYGITAPDGFWDRVHRQEGNSVHMFKDGAWQP